MGGGKRERDESGPEYLLLELVDTMEADCSYYYYIKRDLISAQDIEKILDPESDWALFTEKGQLSEGWTHLSEERQAFTREHWCELVVIPNE